MTLANSQQIHMMCVSPRCQDSRDVPAYNGWLVSPYVERPAVTSLVSRGTP